MRKKILLKIILIGLGIFSSLPNMIYAKEGDTKFFINGRQRWDAEVVIKEDRTYVPLRIVGEELGVHIAYDNKNKHIEVKKENKVLEVNIGESEALLNGGKLNLSSKAILHTTEDGRSLAYVPLRNIFEIFDGVVDDNKDYGYVNAYNKDHVTYKALEDLKSEDLTTYRFAQLALPRVGQENMLFYGGREIQYIFPLNKKTNYFFIKIDPSGDAYINSMAYMEIQNGIAVCKWYKEVRGDVYENINPLDNAINRSLGDGGIAVEIGEFPDIEETSFIAFKRHDMMQPPPNGEYADAYKEIFNEIMMSILAPEGSKAIAKDLIKETLWSPYVTAYQVSHGDGTASYTSYYNNILLSIVDEEKVLKK